MAMVPVAAGKAFWKHLFTLDLDRCKGAALPGRRPGANGTGRRSKSTHTAFSTYCYCRCRVMWQIYGPTAALSHGLCNSDMGSVLAMQCRTAAKPSPNELHVLCKRSTHSS